jgi:hypothetical protein
MSAYAYVQNDYLPCGTAYAYNKCQIDGIGNIGCLRQVEIRFVLMGCTIAKEWVSPYYFAYVSARQKHHYRH